MKQTLVSSHFMMQKRQSTRISNSSTKELLEKLPEKRRIKIEPIKNQISTSCSITSEETISIPIKINVTKQIESYSNEQASSSSTINNNLYSKMKFSDESLLEIIKAKSHSKKKDSTIKNRPTLSVLSIREKYEELLENNKKFLMPFESKTLIKLFEKLDSILEYLEIRNEPSFLTNISNSLRESLALNFTISHFKKILSIFPDSYIYKWEKNLQLKNQYDIHISFPNNENFFSHNHQLENRLIKFKELMLNFIKNKHLEFLKENKIEYLENELVKNTVWHDLFQLNSIIVPEVQLIQKPLFDNTLLSLSEFLEKSTVKNKNLLKIMTETIEKKQKAQVLPIKKNENNLKIAENLGISQKLLEIIKQKENLIPFRLNQSPKKISKNNLKTIASQIKSYYSLRKVNNAFLVSILDYLVKGNTNMTESMSEIKEKIILLIEVSGKWIDLIKHEKGEILRLNGSVNLAEVLQMIENWDN